MLAKGFACFFYNFFFYGKRVGERDRYAKMAEKRYFSQKSLFATGSDNSNFKICIE